MSKARPRSGLTGRHFTDELRAYDLLLHDGADESRVACLYFVQLACPDRLHVIVPCRREQRVQDFLAGVLDLSVEVTSDLASDAIPDEIGLVLLAVASDVSLLVFGFGEALICGASGAANGCTPLLSNF